MDIIAKYLSSDCKLTKLTDHSAANTTTITSAEVDMAGFSGVVFFSSYGTAAANNVATVTASDTSAAEADTTTTCTSGTSDEDVIIDVFEPTYRYLKVAFARGTSSTLESIWALQYGARSKAQSSDLAGTSNVTQATGLTLA
jgi:hypothetical protein